MNYIKKIAFLLTINAASIITSNAADNKSIKEFETSGPIVRTQSEVKIN